ncbi:MAG: hypothetical protein K9H48_19350 [Melioribacteraceae bacterium]|nr:hypothetical protein [Saprospiraceae bacterium]MCF8356606.1 hypothetical protein [Melioribacteraceae bacterium]MCF8395990.1 hypothetical protein [Melioribacteraceae bacterium]
MNNKIIKYTTIFLMIIFIIYCDEKTNDKNLINTFNINEDINKYFKLVDTISLDNHVLIADVHSLDVNKNGQLLVTDQRSKRIYLFSKTGKLIKELKVDSCDPGYKWSPESANFKKDGEIVILDPIGIRFTPNGKCIKKMNTAFFWPAEWSFMNDGRIIGYSIMPGESAKLKVMNKDGEELFSFGRFPNRLKNLRSRSFDYVGILCDNQDNIYQLNPNALQLYKYDNEFNFVEEFNLIVDNFIKITDDLRKVYYDGPGDFINDMNRIRKNRTRAWGMDLLDKDKIMIYYLHNSNILIQIYSTKGKYLLDEDIRISQRFSLAKYGYAYMIKQPEANKEGYLPNPIIEKYQYIYEEKTDE